jgi:outer membrane protein insertion porin family
VQSACDNSSVTDSNDKVITAFVKEIEKSSIQKENQRIGLPKRKSSKTICRSFFVRSLSLLIYRLAIVALLSSAAAVSIASASEVTIHGAGRVSQQFIKSEVRGSSDADLDQATKALYGSGQFEDVKVTRKGSDVTVDIKEAPLVSYVVFNGNSRLKDEQLAGVVKMRAGTAYSQLTLDADITSIRNAYEKLGRLDVKVTPQKLEQNGRVVVAFNIDEGAKTQIDTIYFTGNASFSAAELRSVITTKESSLLSSILNKDIYDVDKLDRDREAIVGFYKSKGFEDVSVSDPDVTFQPDKHVISIGFSISEGQRYTFGAVHVDSTVAGYAPNDQTHPFKGRRIYSPKAADAYADRIQEAAQAISPNTVSVAMKTDRQPGGVMNLAYDVDNAKNVYIQRIDIVGNNQTKDYVIRRELDFSEGDRLDLRLVHQAERRLKALQFFRSVVIKSQRGDADDRVVMTIVVDEDKTGEFSIGAGYSGSDGVLAEVGLSQKNFMGSGRGFNISVGRGEDTSTFNIGLTEPHLLGTRATGFIEAYHREVDSQDNGYHPYDEKLTGGRIGLRAPITDDVTASLYYAAYERKVSDVQTKYQVGRLIETGSSFTSLVGYTFDYNTLDNLTSPSDGIVASFDQQFAGVGGDASFIRTEAKARVYNEVEERHNVVASLSGRIGQIAALGDDLSFFDSLKNDSDLVRGFERGGIGPRDQQTGYSLGGQFYMGASAEATAPLPLAPENLGLRAALFADVGTVFSADKGSVKAASAKLQGDDLALRASLGTGVIWDSPIGLIRANIALPVLKEDYDKTQLFSFSAGTRF